jgi:hypothetical protein
MSQDTESLAHPFVFSNLLRRFKLAVAPRQGRDWRDGVQREVSPFKALSYQVMLDRGKASSTDIRSQPQSTGGSQVAAAQVPNIRRRGGHFSSFKSSFSTSSILPV